MLMLQTERLRRQQRRVWVAVVIVATVVLSGLAIHKMAAGTPHAASRAPTTAPTPIITPSNLATSGAGTFDYATGTGAVLGKTGAIQAYHVAVEKGADTAHGGEDVAAFASDIDAILGSDQSWIAGGKVRFQRVPQATTAAFTVYLATAGTSEKMCADGGLHTGQMTSCRLPGKVIINLTRWMTAAIGGWNASLQTYRSFEINHGVGRQLGNDNEACPVAGKPAPVMMQQSLGLQGCEPNGEPYINGALYSGPKIP